MSKHSEIYNRAFGITEGDYRASELSGEPGVDIHHIDARGMGGDPKGKKDRIEYLMALTRKEHVQYGDKKQYKRFLFERHRDYMIQCGVKFDHKFMQELIEKHG